MCIAHRDLFPNFVRMKRIELLAPARDLEAAVAAVDYGADALYIGGAQFGARAKAGNTVETIARVAEYAHRFGVRVYCTLNTLLLDDELPLAERQARELISAGVDALIVQDMAYLRMDLPVELHASTQMYNRTPEGIAFLERCGFARVILERALSIGEIRALHAATNMEMECFVHGAICVCHSGRCFLSRSMDARRSGNRGACGQPCRLPWDLEDASGRRIAAGKHLLSVRDLNLSARVGELMDAGVTSFKIEGRLKDTNYIRNVVAFYRQRIDDQIALRTEFVRSSAGGSVFDFTPDPAKSFTRGESEYFFAGRRAGVASFDTPKAIGEFVGRVECVERDSFCLDRAAELAAGDGLCFLGSGTLTGTSINRVGDGRIEPNRMEGVAPGADVYRNYDRRFNQALQHSRTHRSIPAQAAVRVAADRIAVRFEDAEGIGCEVVREAVFELSKEPALMAETIRKQMARSGDTPFDVRHVDPGDGRWFVPVSLLAALRREGLEELLRRRLACPVSHRWLPEDRGAPFPRRQLTAADNVTNHLSGLFYRDHGVEHIEPGFDAGTPTVGRRVMECTYCIRREMGECLREGSRLGGELFLVRGVHRYRLEFDCARCLMYVVDDRDGKMQRQ